jgi:hypothetical protein
MKRNTKKARRISKHNKKHNKTNRRARHTTKRVRGGEEPEEKPDKPLTAETISDKDIISKVLEEYKKHIDTAIEGKEFNDKNIPEEITYAKEFLSDNDNKNRLMDEILKNKDISPYDKLWEDINTINDINALQRTWGLNQGGFEKLQDIIYKYKDADNIVTKITELLGKSPDKQQLTDEQIENIKNILNNKDTDNIVTKITELLGKSSGKKQLSDEQIENIKNILNNKDTDDITTKITELLGKLSGKEKLTNEQIENIKNILNNKDKKNTLDSLSTKFASGIQSLGSWLVPQPSGPQKEYNETKVHFLWYPRMYPRYRKGNSNAEKTIKYGDFMVYIEPEKYASTLEFINQTTSGVDDLLTNILNGYQHPSVIPDPVRHTISKITNNQPQLDKDALINPNVKKPSPQEKK